MNNEKSTGLFKINNPQASFTAILLALYNTIFPDHDTTTTMVVNTLIPFVAVLLSYIFLMVYSYLPSPWFRRMTKLNASLEEALKTPNISEKNRKAIIEDINNNIAKYKNK